MNHLSEQRKRQNAVCYICHCEVHIAQRNQKTQEQQSVKIQRGGYDHHGAAPGQSSFKGIQSTNQNVVNTINNLCESQEIRNTKELQQHKPSINIEENVETIKVSPSQKFLKPVIINDYIVAFGNNAIPALYT